MKKIRIITFGKNIFFSNNLLSILNLRNDFRIFGHLLNFYISAIYRQMYLFLSLEEILVGIEFGFLSFSFLKFKKNDRFYFLSLKYFFKNIKYLKKKLNNSNIKANSIETNSELLIRIWRESVLIILFVLKEKCIIYQKNKNPVKSKLETKRFCLLNFLSKIKKKNFFKFKIFRDLWQRGLIITCGIKFGATYLTYAGEISVVHASSSVIALEKSEFIYPQDLVSFGRVGTSTKKRCLLAFIKSNFCINYIGLKWNSDLP